MDACTSAIFSFSTGNFRFIPETLFLGKFGPKYRNCQFKLKFGTQSNSNIQNSVVVLTFSVLARNHPFFLHFIFSALPKLYYFTQSACDYLKNINDAIMSMNKSDLIHVMLYRSKNFDNNMNISILTATIIFIKDTERFDLPLF